MPRRFPGIHCVLYALFDAGGRLDRGAMAAQVRHVLAAGVDGVTVLGLATEVLKLDAEERRRVIDWAAEDVAGRVPLSVTIAGNSIAEQRALAAHATASGADWLVLQPPMVGSYGAAEYVDFFAAVGETLTLPWAVQNAPAYLGRSLAPDDVARLRERAPLCTHIKAESAAVDVAGLITGAGADLCVLNGRGGLEMTDNLRVGCQGFVLAPDAVDHAVTLWRFWQAGDTAAAEQAYREALPAITFVMQSLEGLIGYGKRLFAHRVGLTVHDRAPALRPTATGLALMERHATALGPWPHDLNREPSAPVTGEKRG